MGTKLFVSGSRFIKNLPDKAKDILDRVVISNIEIIIGDSVGIDSMVQDYLFDLGYNQVTVYYSGRCRYNRGFKTKEITPPTELKYKYYFYKDRAMVKDSTAQLVIWDGKSGGSFMNIINGINIGNYMQVLLDNEIIDSNIPTDKLMRKIVDRYMESNNMVSPVKVINIHHKQDKEYEYIGRGSPLGNKFTHLTDSKYNNLVICKDRDEAVDRHYEYFKEKFYERNEVIVNEIRRLWSVIKERGEVKLGCYCYPKRCHGDNIKLLLDELYCIEKIKR